jgi:23S rRNA (guanosine2251-2'-O)-methyltransferase
MENLSPDGPSLILALDHIEDPHNLGALLRTAAAFGVKAALVPSDRSAGLTQAARAASAGGSEAVPLITVVNLQRTLTKLKNSGFWLVGAEASKGESVSDFKFPSKTVLILGSEAKGISPLAAKGVDFWVHIPLAPGVVSSLNVSNAGAILMQGYFSQFPI